ncbi:MAG TPA: elongation factor P [Terriglobales bacterium]|nr:elongation factor P [Terriglobales bacterium]
MQIPATQLRPGMVIDHRKDLVRVLSVVHVTPGNWRGMVQTKLRKIDTGTQLEHRFRSEDRVERIVLEQHDMEFLYADGDQYHFMNTENYEQVALTAEDLGDAVKFLKPNLRVEVEFHEHRPIGIDLPNTVDLRVTETEPGIRNATATNVLKPATVETGAIIQVPVFVNIDDVIRVSTETGEYLSRAK